MKLIELQGKYTVVQAYTSRDAHGKTWALMLIQNIKTADLRIIKTGDGHEWSDPEPLPPGEESRRLKQIYREGNYGSHIAAAE